MTHEEMFAGSPIKVGQRYTFDYPEEFTSLDAYSDHRGQSVIVVRPTTATEADVLWDKVDASVDEEIIDRMFVVQADDGWIGHAWESELVSAQATRHAAVLRSVLA